MTIKDALNLAKQEIDYIDAKILMKYILNVDESYLIINSQKEIEKQRKYFELVKKVKEGYPVQYITKHQEFMGNNFYVNENVLIPQPDTEVLVEQTIKYAEKMQEPKILDLCTGSGAIAISLKKYIKNADIIATDISLKALKVAQKNAKQNNVNIKFVKSDMFEKITEKFDIIVSNPPYIKTDIINTLDKDVQKEPQIALDGGEDGLKYYKIIAKNITKFLKPRGVVLLEIGYDQAEEVAKLFDDKIKIVKDYEGRDRVVIWNLSQEK